MERERFSRAFEEEAVPLIRTSGRTKRKIGEDLGVSLSTLTRWLPRAVVGDGAADRLGVVHGDGEPGPLCLVRPMRNDCPVKT